MSDDLQKLLEKLRVEVSRIREQGDIDITRFDWVEHADEIERIAYGIESALSSLQAQSGEKGIEGRARELLEIGKSLVELDEEANSLGTDSWAWLRQVEDFLAASSNPASVQASLESLKLEIRKQAWQECEEACMEIILGSLPVMAAVDCDHMAVALDARDRDVRLKARKQAFEEAAEHEPREYLGYRGYDWECRCGTCGVWRGATNWPERIRWPDHIRALASALAVPAEEKK